MSERWSPRVTVAVVVERGGDFLMVEERIEGKLVLNQPAGHVEPGESLIEAAHREVLEETRWRVKLIGLLGVHRWTREGSDSAWLRFVFSAQALDEVPGPLDPPVLAARWVSRAELKALAPRYRSPLVKAALDAYDAGVAAPLRILQDLVGEPR